MSTSRARLVGVAIGVVVPLLALLVVLVVARRSGDGDPVIFFGSSVWSLVAFLGVLLIAWERTRPLAVGILIGFSGLILVGAGTCTAVVMGGAM